jgi:ABC-2 type transport system ATP-binding protein
MTATVVRASGLIKRYGSFTAVDAVDFVIEENRIYGLLGRNGAGKTTIMQVLTGQLFPDGGTLEVFGREPAEHADVLRRLCFIAESQRYPDAFTPADVFAAAPWFYENWDAEFAAPLTFFDEPYLGLDAVARQIFYDRLLEDFAENPRTVILSTHLIDEVANLLEHVILIDEGRIILDRDADEVRGSAATVAGPSAAVDAFVADRPVIGRQSLGGLASVTIDGKLDQASRQRAAALGLELAPVSLQQLIIHLTGDDAAGSTAGEAAA